MAKKQTRRSVSLARATYDAAIETATAAGLSCSEWITQLIRGAVPGLPETAHFNPVAREVRRPIEPTVRVFVTASTPVPPGQMPRNLKLEIAQADAMRKRAGLAAGTLCANCVEAKATHIGRVDLTGATYPICDACELPTEKRCAR